MPPQEDHLRKETMWSLMRNKLLVKLWAPHNSRLLWTERPKKNRLSHMAIKRSKVEQEWTLRSKNKREDLHAAVVVVVGHAVEMIRTPELLMCSITSEWSHYRIINEWIEHRANVFYPHKTAQINENKKQIYIDHQIFSISISSTFFFWLKLKFTVLSSSS